jgi:hypothetical protein
MDHFVLSVFAKPRCADLRYLSAARAGTFHTVNGSSCSVSARPASVTPPLLIDLWRTLEAASGIEHAFLQIGSRARCRADVAIHDQPEWVPTPVGGLGFNPLQAPALPGAPHRADACSLLRCNDGLKFAFATSAPPNSTAKRAWPISAGTTESTRSKRRSGPSVSA